MAWADAGQRSEAMPVVRTGRDFAVSNRPIVSTSATAACRCRYQSLTAGGMIYDRVSINLSTDNIITYPGQSQSSIHLQFYARKETHLCFEGLSDRDQHKRDA